MGNLRIESQGKNVKTDMYKSLSFTFTLTMPTIIISRLKLQYVVTYFSTPLVHGPEKFQFSHSDTFFIFQKIVNIF